MMLKKIILSVAVLGAVVFTNAQQIDATSKKILDAVTQKYNQQKNSYFKFMFGSGANGKVSRKEMGDFYSEGDKYVLNVMGTKQIFNGQKIYNINEEDQEVTIAKPDENDAVFSPINYLKNYRQDFNVSHKGTRTVLKKKVNLIKLIPIQSNGLSHVYLFVDAKNNELVKLEQYGKNKDVAVIVVTEHKTNQNLSPNLFTFDKSKYKDYLITEL